MDKDEYRTKVDGYGRIQDKIRWIRKYTIDKPLPGLIPT